MLRRCLTAISNLTRPAGIDLSVIVVDNEAEPNNRSVAEEFPGVLYKHEPCRGLSHARNAAIEAALDIEADFIAFTDDDCEPAEYWLDQLLIAQRETGADVVRGRTVYVYPDPLPEWILKPTRFKSRRTEEDGEAGAPPSCGREQRAFFGASRP
jgi:succinoglycan biosynthesis protein ExoM